MNNHKTNENLEKTASKKCDCSSLQGLFIANRQLSVAVSLCIAMLFFSFMTGYFFGGQHAAQDFMYHVDHVSCNDQMSSSLCALAKECTTTVIDNNQDTVDLAYNSFQEPVRNITENPIAEDAIAIQLNEKKYYAQLIGFGTHQAAQRFVKKLEKKQIHLEINKHSSRTAQGKTINWYQVTTLPYADKQQLIDLVDFIQKTEKIVDTRIITC